MRNFAAILEVAAGRKGGAERVLNDTRPPPAPDAPAVAPEERWRAASGLPRTASSHVLAQSIDA